MVIVLVKDHIYTILICLHSSPTYICLHAVYLRSAEPPYPRRNWPVLLRVLDAFIVLYGRVIGELPFISGAVWWHLHARVVAGRESAADRIEVCYQLGRPIPFPKKTDSEEVRLNVETYRRQFRDAALQGPDYIRVPCGSWWIVVWNVDLAAIKLGLGDRVVTREHLDEDRFYEVGVIRQMRTDAFAVGWYSLEEGTRRIGSGVKKSSINADDDLMLRLEIVRWQIATCCIHLARLGLLICCVCDSTEYPESL
jgi:hypothetical protein